MKLTFLGTGTSSGVPQIGCRCKVCRSIDFRDKRLRSSALLETPTGSILIDCGPDFRTQFLSFAPSDISALVITHSHYDHIGGLDDLRPFCRPDSPFPIYAQGDVIDRIKILMPYTTGPNKYPGAPTFELHELTAGTSTYICDIKVTPLKVSHTPTLDILGYRIGNLGYITDCKVMPPETLQELKGIETLVINALRHTTHPSHMNLKDAINVISNVNPKTAFLTHLSHDMGLCSEVEPTLPKGIRIAYDGLTITC